METPLRYFRWLACLSVALVTAFAVLPSGAAAQAWMSDRSRTEGPGFRVGDFELHPGLGVEIGYDSNLYYSDDDEVFPVVDTGVLRATAHLLFSTRGAQRRQEGEAGGGEANNQNASLPSVTFRGGVSGAFYTFFNDLDRSNMEVDASLALAILPGRAFSVSLTEEFGRSIRPFTENSMTRVSYARLQNDVGLQLNFATPGEVLKITPGYRFGLTFFEDAFFQWGNRFTHTVSLTETFRFLPQTAIVHDTSFVALDYFGDASMAPVLTNDAYTLRSRIGLNGALTSNFSFLAMVGYAAGFFESGLASYDQEYESVVAQVEARWQISEPTRLTFGYERDFQPSFIGNWYRRDRGYATFQWLIDGRFMLGTEAGFGHYEFGRIVQPDGMALGTTLTRGDYRLDVSLFGEYRFTDWLGLNATLQYTGAFTDYQYRVATPPPDMAIIDPAGFNKFQEWFGARVFY
ncbi:MAG: hypothetical protein RID93_21445 [Sandaracinaceae bacterium]